MIADQAGIKYDHFSGRKWRLGHHFAQNEKPLDKVLVLNGEAQNNFVLMKRIILHGLKPELCSNCGLDKWLGQKIPLTLRFRNNNHNDYRIENLSIVCHNCSSILKRDEKSTTRKPIYKRKKAK